MSATRRFALSAIEPLPAGNWISITFDAVESIGYNAHTGKSVLYAWNYTRPLGRVRFTDAWSFHRLWLGCGRWALAVSTKRLYFSDLSGALLAHPEHRIVGSRRPTSEKADLVAAQAVELIDQLCQTKQFAGCRPVLADRIGRDLSADRVLLIQEKSVPWTSGSLNEIYLTFGFDYIPEGSKVSVCPIDGTTTQAAEQFRKWCVTKALKRKLGLTFRLSTPTEIEERLVFLQDRKAIPMKSHCVLFLLPSRDRPITANVSKIFSKMESLHVPFRRAYQDDPCEFSIPDQLPSLLLACGGSPHRVNTWRVQTDLWTVGVDLSHRKDDSVLALTLIDPGGLLQGAWTAHQRRDETVCEAVLVELLRECKRRLALLTRDANVLVVRDGRFFANEKMGTYRQIIGERSTLIEYRKRGNPMVVDLGASIQVATPPAAYLIDNENTLFVSLTRCRTERDLPRFSKVTWQREWNGLTLNAGDIAGVLASLSAAPGLGMHPKHLPAPIYWADGVANASDADLRFRGQVVHQMLGGFEQSRSIP